MKLILAVLIWISSSAFAFENNCRVDTTSSRPSLVIDGRQVEFFAFPAEAYNALERARLVGACSPSNCAIGKINTPATLIIDGRETNFVGNFGAALMEFANWKAAHFCDLETTQLPAEDFSFF